MKKLFSISVALLILISGMHLTLSSHFCGGEIAAVKFSISGEIATCGMETSKQTCPADKSIASNCCHNEVVVYAIDNNYNPSSLQIKEVTQTLLQVFYIPVSFSINQFQTSNPVCSIVSPPGNVLASAVSLSDICIFRI